MLTEEQQLKQLISESVVDLLKRGSKFAMLYMILKKLTTNFTNWKAYKLGIIDNAGNIIKPRKERKSAAEKEAMTMLDVFCLNVKKLLQKIPGNRSSLLTMAGALFLVKEQEENRIDDIHIHLLENRLFQYFEEDDRYRTVLTEMNVAGNVYTGGGAPAMTEPVIKLVEPFVTTSKKKKKKKKTTMLSRSQQPK